jgi:hypothetical protein
MAILNPVNITKLRKVYLLDDVFSVSESPAFPLGLKQLSFCIA